MKHSSTRSRTVRAATATRSKGRPQRLVRRTHSNPRPEAVHSAWDDIDAMEVDSDTPDTHHPATNTGTAEARRRIEMLREEQLLREALNDIF